MLITSIDIKESKFFKHGCLLSESIAADQLQNRPMRQQYPIVGVMTRIEMHQQ